MQQGWLFEPVRPAFQTRLAERLTRLASEGILIGTSSWKYEGWLGQIYTRERYLSRGKFSAKLFEERCIEEYAETFPVVCGDFTFYQFPGEAYWERLFRTAPAGLRFAFKAPEEITARLFPAHARYGSRGGHPNPAFLDAEVFTRLFTDPLMRYRDRVAAIIFEFGTFSKASYETTGAFLRDLTSFVRRLPPDFRYAAEIRNPEFFGAEYLACLRELGVAHTFNSWTRMPELPTQIAMPGSRTADFLVCRALLQYGRAYEDAVRMFQPYASVQEPYPAARVGLRAIVKAARESKTQALVFVNNRLEGNAPGTIAAVVDED
ncbi:MAG: DUF72 domain-containing protein [Acidobacteria bacterium]|nr:DUF72 domain-containing protein [Acidobacteriota bacterium]